MKKLFYMAVAAIAALSSCSNDDILSTENANNNPAKAPVFTARIEGEAQTRTVLNNNKVNWASGDKVFIAAFTENDAATVVVGDYSVTPGSDATTATLSPSNLLYSADGEPATIIGIYPASIAYYNESSDLQQQVVMNAASTPNSIKWGALSLNLPTEQTYNENDISQIAPMVAISSSTNLEFKNLSALLAITVKANDFTSVRSIKVSSEDGSALSGGSFDINEESLVLETGFMGTYNNYVILNCQSEGANTTIPSGGSKTFYVSIPANTYGYLQIDVTDGTSTKTMKTTAASISVARNKIYNIAFEDNQTPATDPNLLAGVYSVSPTKKVKFTKGNLYCNASVSPATFGFETNQYDFPTSYPTLTGDVLWNCDHVGHFFWKKWEVYSDASSNAYRNMPYYATCGTGDISTTDVFWCGETHPLEVAGTQGLYVLSADEWNYLLNEEGNEGRTGNRYALAKYKDKYGIIIFPDGYTGTTSGEGIGEVNGAWNETNPSANIPDDTWTAMEAAGVVFLPSAGYRIAETITSGYCQYWSSTPYDVTTARDYEKYAYCLYVVNYSTNQTSLWSKGNARRERGSSIRLVKTVE